MATARGSAATTVLPRARQGIADVAFKRRAARYLHLPRPQRGDGERQQLLRVAPAGDSISEPQLQLTLSGCIERATSQVLADALRLLAGRR